MATTISWCHAAEPFVLEFRRTYSAPDCSTGDLYVNGQLTALFHASPELFNERLKTNPFVGETATSEVFDKPIAYLGNRILGARLIAAGATDVRLLALDENSYWNYDRPRKKARAIPSDVILLGTQVQNRECKIYASNADFYYDSNWYYAWTSGILAQTLYANLLTKQTYVSGKVVDALSVFTDASDVFSISMGAINYGRKPPNRVADMIGAGDACLTALEHVLAPNEF